MDNHRTAFVTDIILSLVIIIFSVVIYINTLDLPPPKYEPMGAAALPQILAALLIIFSIFIFIKAIIRKKPAGASTDKTTELGDVSTFQESVTSARSYIKAAIVFALTCVYVFVMSTKLSGFMPATMVYIFVAGTIMKPKNLVSKAKMAAFAIVFALATFYIFTGLFYIDLP